MALWHFTFLGRRGVDAGSLAGRIHPTAPEC